VVRTGQSMEDNCEVLPGSLRPRVYQIRVEAHLGAHWADWFEGLTITQEANGETLLTGPVVDQAVLHSLLRKVRDLGLSLVSVIRVEPEQPDMVTPRADDAGKGNRP
jgi:hypothetical protein